VAPGDDPRNPGGVVAGVGRPTPSGAGGSDDRQSHSDAAGLADAKGAAASLKVGAVGAGMRPGATLANGVAPNANGARPVNRSAATPDLWLLNRRSRSVRPRLFEPLRDRLLTPTRCSIWTPSRPRADCASVS